MTCNKLFSLFIIGFGLIAGGCASSDDDSSSSSNPAVPADAVIITSANAETIATSAAATTDTATEVFVGIETSLPPAQLAMNSIVKHAFDKNRRSYSIASGITVTDNCATSGSYTYSGTETATAENGRITFAQCSEDGLTLNGSFTFNSTWNDTTGAYTDKGNGTLTISTGADSFTMAINYSATGNDYDGSFSTTMTFSISGSGLGGFLLETTQPLTGTYYTGATAGQYIITGANNTRLRITLINAYTATVELDNGSGTFVMQNNNFSI